MSTRGGWKLLGSRPISAEPPMISYGKNSPDADPPPGPLARCGGPHFNEISFLIRRLDYAIEKLAALEAKNRKLNKKLKKLTKGG